MEFLKDLFVDGQNNTRWGSVVSVLLGGGAGLWLGGGGVLGALLGGGLGMLLAPVVNETFFQAGRSMATITPPPRTYEIKPNIPLKDVPAPVKQPSGEFSPTSIKAPILENIKVPPPHAIDESLKRREGIWKLLSQGGGDRKAYEQAVNSARELERQTDVFIATIDEYHKVRAEYLKPGGQRKELVVAVKTALTRTGITNPLTNDEIERFVPTLPALTEDEQRIVATQLATAVPETLQSLGNTATLKFRASVEKFFTHGKGNAPIPAKVEEWKKKTSLEKINIALDRMDEMRADFTYYNPIDWNAAVGDKTGATGRGSVLSQMTPEAMYAEAVRLEAEAKGDANRLAVLDDVKFYANVLNYRTQLESVVKTNLGAVSRTYTEFTDKKLVPATEQAHEFAKQRLEIFNQTGIAILDKGGLDKANAPDGKANSYFITCKDCTAPAGAKEVTLVMQKVGSVFVITHKLEGSIAAGVDWSKAALKDGGVPVSEALFTKLQAPEGKTIDVAFKEILAAVKAQPLALAYGDTDMRELGEEQPRYAFLDGEDPQLTRQNRIPLKKKEKIDLGAGRSETIPA